MLGTPKSRAYMDLTAQDEASTFARTPMKTEVGPHDAVDWSYGRNSQDHTISTSDHKGHANLRSSRRVLDSMTPSYQPLRRQEATTMEYTQANNAPRYKMNGDPHAACETDSESECSILGSRDHHASTSYSNCAKRDMSEQIVATHHDIVTDGSEDRSRPTRHTKFHRLDRSLYPERSQKPMRLRKVLISDRDAVTNFFESRLKDMQQLATKKIAKAWIKGICPRKQALFPYQDSSRRRECEDPNVPEWWPRPEFCSFREPDHIKKEERTYLLIHILRLRPTTAQLKQWHNGTKEPLPPAANSAREDWAPFLRTLAPESIFDDMPDIDGNERKRAYRAKLLDSMYAVAFMEEKYCLTGLHNDEFYHYEEEEKRVKSSVKRSNADSTDITTRENMADAKSEMRSPAHRSSKRIKKSRQYPVTGMVGHPLRSHEDNSFNHPKEVSGISCGSLHSHLSVDNLNILRQPMTDLHHASHQDSPQVYRNDSFHDATNTNSGWYPASSVGWASQQQNIPTTPEWSRTVSALDSSTIASFDTSDTDHMLRYDPCLADFDSGSGSSQGSYNYNSSFHPQSQPQHLQVNTIHVPVPHFEQTFSPMGTLSLPFDFPMTPALQDILNFTTSSMTPIYPAPMSGIHDIADTTASSHVCHERQYEASYDIHSTARAASVANDLPSSLPRHHQSTYDFATQTNLLRGHATRE